METGKTGAEEKNYLFCWNEVPRKDSDRLIGFLRDKFDIGWAGYAEITKPDDNTICISHGENAAKILIDEKEKKATLTIISDGRTCNLKVKKENDKLNIYKMKEVYVLISVKPKYAEEFCIMMVACKALCTRVSESKNLAEIDEVFSVLGPFDFLLKLSGEGKNEEEMDEKINTTVFKIRETLGSYINETCTLTKFELSRFLEDDARERLKKAESFKEDGERAKFREFFEKLNTHGDQKDQEGTKTFNGLDKLRKELDLDTANVQKTAAKNKMLTKDVHVLIKIKPEYTEKFYVAMAVCKNLCNGSPASQNLAKINEFCSVLGPFDFLLKIIGVGKEKMHEKINRTLLKIRETLGSYVNETLTLTKFKIPMTREELENFFEKKLGVKNLVKLPDKDGETIPDESLKPDDEIDLKEMYDAETTSLKSLLKEAKKSFDPEYLKKGIDNLAERIEELEKKK